jgi:hypothetical protein
VLDAEVTSGEEAVSADEVVPADELSAASEVVLELGAELVAADEVSFAVASGVTTSYRDAAPFHKAHTFEGAGWISRRPDSQQLGSPSQQKDVSLPVAAEQESKFHPRPW